MIKINDHYSAEYYLLFLIYHQSESLKNNSLKPGFSIFGDNEIYLGSYII